MVTSSSDDPLDTSVPSRSVMPSVVLSVLPWILIVFVASAVPKDVTNVTPSNPDTSTMSDSTAAVLAAEWSFSLTYLSELSRLRPMLASLRRRGDVLDGLRLRQLGVGAAHALDADQAAGRVQLVQPRHLRPLAVADPEVAEVAERDDLFAGGDRWHLVADDDRTAHQHPRLALTQRLAPQVAQVGG